MRRLNRMPATLALALMLAQSLPTEATDAAKMERIRKALTEAPAMTVPPATRAEGPVFRVTVQGWKPGEPLWDNWTAVPSYIRPWFRGDHHEFLEQVTKEEFRGPTLYPTGIPVVAVIEFLAKQIRAGQRKAGEAKAREEVRLALEHFLECRSNPARPGC
jgi:hypothetical protein